MWNLPRPGVKPVFPALPGGFSSTGPPGKFLRVRLNASSAVKPSWAPKLRCQSLLIALYLCNCTSHNCMAFMCWHEYLSSILSSWPLISYLSLYLHTRHLLCSCVCVCARACVLTQSCPTLCDPMDCIPPGSSVRGISQARILEWVAISSSRDLPNPGIEPASLASPVLASRFFTTSATWEDVLLIHF